jgi:monoamine oxidase
MPDGAAARIPPNASYLNAWQEGAALSALEAITRLHQRIVAG